MQKLLKILLCATGMLLVTGLACAAAPKALSLAGAKWVWNAGAGSAQGAWYFRKEFAFPAGQKPRLARIVLSCDNEWTLYVNGKQVGRDGAWERPRQLDVTEHLVIEQNAIAVKGVNTAPGPAGLIVRLHVVFEDGKTYEILSDGTWTSSAQAEKQWAENGFTGDDTWKAVEVLGPFGIQPWGRIASGNPSRQARPRPSDKAYSREMEFKDEIFRDGVVFVGNSMGFKASGQQTYVQFIRRTRAYFEMDPMTPAAIGAQLWSLIPFKPDGKKTLLYEVKPGGKLGSPSVSYDGKTVYFALAKGGEAYFHVYAVSPDGSGLRQLTDGPFHDYDPVELPDGRIAFSSTRIGSREEYHAKYASSIFTLDSRGLIRPLTYHIVADREPRVMADGSLVFVRMDNFLERAKVEVHLHQTRLDGSGGQVIIGPARRGIRVDRDAAAEHPMNWLRKYGAGSPAPMPDGRVIAINQKGLVSSAEPSGLPVGGSFLPYDLSPLTDGRLLCTALHKNAMLIFNPADKVVKQVVSAAELGVRDLHSAVHLGPRKKPSVFPSQIDPAVDRRRDKTGFLYCQNVLNTQHVATDVARIKALRIYEGRPFTLEPTKSIYEHIGTIGVELGTVPLAEDGSVYVEVPADRPLAMQAVDGEGRAVINELSWVYSRPGEQRSCVGCHAPADAAPTMMASKALAAQPLKLLGQGTPHRFRANNGANGGIANLQLDRFREVAAINLGDVGEEPELSTLRRLGILRNREAVPLLVKALEDEMVECRVAAALSLSACGDRNAVKPLMALLDDQHPAVRRAAASALEHLTGDPAGNTDWEALEKGAISRMADEDHQVVHLAIECLGHIGGDDAKKALRDYLVAHPDGELRILMAAIRSLGYLRDRDAVALLTKIMNDNLTKKGKGGHHEFGFGQKPIYLCATSAEALGRIGGCDKVILDAFARLNSFEDYVFRTAEHGWLKGVHSSVVHFRMLEALDRMESKGGGTVVAKIIESIPADKDRGLLYELDSYEKLSARVIARSGRNEEVVAACLAVLGAPVEDGTGLALKASVGKSPHAQGHIRRHSPQARAAQILSICAEKKHSAQVRELLIKYRAAAPSETRSWCCFMLTRTLGRLGDAASVDLLIEMLEKDPTETALGLNPPPAHLVYKGWRPFYRPAAAWSLGQIGAGQAVPVLLETVKNLDNASSTREQAAVALGWTADKRCLPRLREVAQAYPEVMTRRALLDAIARIER